jgi:hypothetical protein
VIEGQTVGVQAVASVAGEAGLALGDPANGVDRIADEGVASHRQVDADLVRTTGRNTHLDETHRDERELVADLQDLHM